MTTLTEAQAAVLTPALARADGCIFPVTAALKGGAVGNVAKSLLKHNMIEEVSATDDAVVWRCNDAGQPLTLRITAAGARCVRGAVVQANELPQASVETPLVMLDGSAHQRGSRQQVLVDLLSRTGSATVAELKAGPAGSRTACAEPCRVWWRRSSATR